MPLYIADYLADTGHLSTVEHGAYMLLIMHYWQHDGLPADEHKLARITRMSIAEWSASRDTLADLFEDGWKHGRIDREITSARETMSKRSAAGKAGAYARYGNRTGNRISIEEQPNAPVGEGVCLETSPQEQADQEEASPREREFSEAFWSAYPNKVGEVRARVAFVEARDKASLEEILAGLSRYKIGKPKDREWMNPEKFLADERWRDEPATTSVAPSPSSDVAWLDEEDPRWGTVAGQWRETKGKPLIPTTSKHGTGFGAFVPSNWLVKAAA
jgi:uncharacterized protein YdaU (DUF1376 family)